MVQAGCGGQRRRALAGRRGHAEMRETGDRRIGYQCHHIKGNHSLSPPSWPKNPLYLISRAASSARVSSPKMRWTPQGSGEKSNGRLHMLGTFHIHALCTNIHAGHYRLGQEPPPQQQEEVYDGRSLAEVSLSIAPALRVVFTFYC